MPKKKKSYNPFKMWGAWVGAGIGLIGGFFQQFIQLNYDVHEVYNKIFYAIFNPSIETFPFYSDLWSWLLLLLPILIGFLIGWAIHSIIRKAR